MRTLPTSEEMYRALVARDPSCDGLFFACVTSTGIFCRTVCTARKPRAENVLFVPTVQEALHRGFRPCRVCRPLEQPDAMPAWAAALVEQLRRQPDVRLDDRALRQRGVHPAQARRFFEQRFGVTFQAFQRAWRLGGAMRELHRGAELLEAGLDAGFESASGFRDAFARVFGAAPGQARDSSFLTAAWLETPLGPMLAIASDAGLVLLEFVDRRALERELRQIRARFRAPIVPGDHPHLARAGREVAEYFAGARTRFGVPLDLRGTPFQLRIWHALLGIEAGVTTHYAALAGQAASRAAGRAVGDNRIAIIVPCHRVIGSDGSLTGYAGGLWRKQWLLDHERQGSAQSRAISSSLNVRTAPALPMRAATSAS